MKVKEEHLMKRFKDITNKEMPKSNLAKDCIKAFVVGGLICDIGQVFNEIYGNLGLGVEETGAFVSITMIFLGSLLTGIGVYDKIGDFAGAGSVVPITGFANSIVAPAMEFKKEGFVFGVAAKMFTIAGPVLVYGIGSSIIVGIIYYFMTLF
ncbi:MULTISPECIES: stage V sporulation protein AC [Clostridium]|uniref:SpoVA protein n=2 Tax=Clostridium TaxID=1485 RepID=A0A151ARB9_9CLOT|nr:MULTISPECIES: stage V sporulation protein AC [Clostridium]KYH30132.1 SpoVA protein [Clostridium colicanis DSM 13634]MBE6044638.1 stage V sporulation protein AC [Clostridium thermopalmarium]PRR75440.1 SpoVA protein [Clostridium thermopalmarium DSM 5974]PVZ24342.1 stage V sporulation protein AC [Clostridium thermopalmarium DSM 5974]